MPSASILAGLEMTGMAYDHRVMLRQLQPLKEELAGAIWLQRSSPLRLSLLARR